MPIAKTPKPPYYAVIFTSIKKEEGNGYEKMADTMLKLAAQQVGFLGVEEARDEVGITVSYWDSLDSITAWKQNSAHLIAQKNGQDIWYAAYQVRICRVERDYEFFKSIN
jgi:heme-degrading monooxygenase HmoA